MPDREESLEERMSRLEKRLVGAESNEAGASDGRSEDVKGMSQALKLSSEFVGAVVVGAMLGFLLDYFLPTGPWGMIVFLLLGFCAGVLNVLRAAGMVKSPHPVDRIGERRGPYDKR